MPKVSVVIPLYNSAPFISDTLDSVLNQTYHDIEIITVDDGSSDATPEIIRAKNDRRVIYIKQENAGISAARNRGIAAAKGEYIAFIDHDDRWLPEKLSEQIKLFESDRSLGFVYSNALIVDEKDIETNNFFNISKPYSRMVFNELLKENFIPILTVIVKRDVLAKTGLFNPKLKIVEDWDFLLRVSRIFPCNYINKCLARYRVHQGSFSKKKEMLLQEIIDVITEYLSCSDCKTIKRLMRNRSRYGTLLGAFYLKRKERGLARKCFLDSIKDNHLGVKPLLGLVGAYLPFFVSGVISDIIGSRSMHEEKACECCQGRPLNPEALDE